jgi:Aspartyl protease
MTRRRGGLGLAAGVLAVLLVAAAPASAQPLEPSAATVLAKVKAAAGGERWDHVATLSAIGEKTSFGLVGPYSAIEDLVTGRFARRCDYGLLANAEGLDALGRWRRDNSGGVHPLDSDEARTVATTEAYLARRGYLFPERGEAAFAPEPPATEGAETFDRIVVTPEGGRAAALWFRRSDRRLDRAVVALANRIQTVRYRDYRAVGGLVLPFEIVTEDGDQLETGDAKITRYRLDDPAAEDALRRPPSRSADARLADGAAVASAPFRLDALGGFPIVEARVNGRGPLLFILDTGGHDILTPAAAAMLGLPLSGSGFSLGAGEGSAPTRFTRVAKVALGAAEMTDQPFVVLELDLGQALGPDNRPTAISGIIGLELFERFTVTLDYAAQRLSLRLPGPEPIAGGAPIRFTSDMPSAEASLDGRGGWFGLDTGNNAGVILFKTWVEAKGLPAWFEVAVDAPGVGIGGPVIFRRGRAGGLTLAGASLPGMPVLLAGDHLGALSSRAEAGNIGESVLSHFAVTFDYAHERVRLDPAPGP